MANLNKVLSGHFSLPDCANFVIPNITNNPIARGKSLFCTVLAIFNTAFFITTIDLSIGFKTRLDTFCITLFASFFNSAAAISDANPILIKPIGGS